jgi:cation transport regulator ChaB
MRYETIEDLPLVCHYNLPEPALRLYQTAYNEAWEVSHGSDRDRVALHSAWRAVRDEFVRDPLTRRWVKRNRA